MVQTFILSDDIKIIFKLLDDRRLGKQRVEAHQIINIIEQNNSNKKIAWQNHPAVLMWKNNVDYLKYYFNLCVTEWIARGKNNNYQLYDLPLNIEEPSWWGFKPLIYSHQANLYIKNPWYYGQALQHVEGIMSSIELFNQYTKIGYIWPSDWSSEEMIAKTPEDLARPLAKKYINPLYCPGIKRDRYCLQILEVNTSMCKTCRKK